MTAQKYLESSRILLSQAKTELAAGDVRQASEKGWGAAAQIVQAIAARPRLGTPRSSGVVPSSGPSAQRDGRSGRPAFV